MSYQQRRREIQWMAESTRSDSDPASDLGLHSVENKQRDREVSLDSEVTADWREVELQQVPCPSDCASKVHVITSIRATDLTLGLERIPAGFYAGVQHSGLEWRTENKRSTVNNDIVEWRESIPMPSDLSATVSIAIYAPLGFQLVLGNGEQLQVLNATVAQLLDHSAKDLPFAFVAKEDEDVSPCSSLLVTIVQQQERIDSSGSKVLMPYRPTAKSQEPLEDATNQGQSALSRYRKNRRQLDLECAVERFQHALDICPPDHPGFAAAQSNLAMTTLIHCQHHNTDASLDTPLALYRSALAARPVGHPDRPSTLIQLAVVHMTKFEKERDGADATEAMKFLHEALGLNSADCYENLIATTILHLHTERTEDIVPWETVSASRLIHASPWGLSGYLLHRFERLGDLANLQHAISIWEAYVRSMTDRDPLYRTGIVNLSVALRYLFEQLGQLNDLEQAISRLQDAVQLIPNDHPYKSTCLMNLGNSLLTRFRRLGELSDLEEAIPRQREAVHLFPRNLKYLDSLALSLFTRFECLGELGDLQDAISSQRDICHLIQDGGYPDKPSYLNNIGNSLFIRFGRLGKLTDLDEAISWQRESVRLSPHGNPDNLRDSMHTRFRHLGDVGDVADLEEAISRRQDAVFLTPQGHTDLPMLLNNLGQSFYARFNRLGEPGDLGEAIQKQRNAVNIAPHWQGHSDKSIHLHNLGRFLNTRFSLLGEFTDLEEAISKQRESILLLPHDHPLRANFLITLGTSLSIRFQHSGEPSDFEEAISSQQDAVDITPDGHPNKLSFLNILGISFKTRFNHLGELSSLEEALRLFMQAARSSTGSATERFHASRQWIFCAHALDHPSLLDAYSTSIGLLPQLAWIGLSVAHRYQGLMDVSHITREAAAIALNLGHLRTAVEWLEQGRSVVWEGLLELRISHGELSSAHPDHARRLQELSTSLENASVTHEKSLTSPMYDTQSHPRESLQQEADRHRKLATERDKLLQEIRQLPGFEKFLLQKEFSQLCASTHSGPVVILNSADNQCDALILLADKEDVMHIPLTGFTHSRVRAIQNTLGNLLASARDTSDDEEGRECQRTKWDQIRWGSLLSMLWKDIVKPVLDALGFTTAGELSRVFWCPTGHFTFLPLHAAGLYGTQHSEPGHKASDFVVSSYVPTLCILLCPRRLDKALTNNFRLLSVKQPPSDGKSPLPGVHEELEYIHTAVRNASTEITLVESSMGTVEEVCDLMEDANWVHFACHGVQDAKNTTNSGLCLADQRRLKVADMISLALSRPRGGLAFLSACQTAKGDQNLSDEAIHIAAGMLYAGFSGVIGTMWSINDKVAPFVAKHVYEQLFSNCGQGRQPDGQEAARALHDAVQRLRGSSASFSDWIPFIHIGL